MRETESTASVSSAPNPSPLPKGEGVDGSKFFNQGAGTLKRR
jgi:hypothetical protein